MYQHLRLWCALRRSLTVQRAPKRNSDRSGEKANPPAGNSPLGSGIYNCPLLTSLRKVSPPRAGCLIAGLEHQPLEVATNQLPVPGVLFPERSLQRMLFSQDLPMDEPCHYW